MSTPLAPTSIAPAAASYALGMAVPAGHRLVITSGIVGTRPDGTISADVGEQAAEMWRSVSAILAEGGLGVTDIVSIVTYVVVGEDLAAVMAARSAHFDGHLAASTLLTVPALAQPQWKVEVQVTAAGPASASSPAT